MGEDTKVGTIITTGEVNDASNPYADQPSGFVEYGIGFVNSTRRLVLREYDRWTGKVRNLPLVTRDGGIYVEENDGK